MADPTIEEIEQNAEALEKELDWLGVGSDNRLRTMIRHARSLLEEVERLRELAKQGADVTEPES